MYVKHLRGPARSKVQSFRQLEHAMPRCAYACGCAYSRTDGVAKAHPVRVRVRVSVRRRERPSHGRKLNLDIVSTQSTLTNLRKKPPPVCYSEVGVLP